MDEHDTDHITKPASVQGLRQDIREIKKDLAEVKLALKGPFPPKPDEQGLVGNMMYVLHTIDGRDEGLRVRVRRGEERIQKLEDTEKESKAWLKGAMFAWGLAGALLGSILPLVAKFVFKL